MKLLKRILAGLLALTLLLSLAACGGGSSEPEAPPNNEDLQEDDAVLTEDFRELSKEELLEYANSSSSLWELTQRFFTDIIIYKDSLGQMTYAPVDPDMPKSNYDWNNLVRLLKPEKELEYQIDGETVSLKGIDVSAYQEDIDWEKVAADDVQFAFIRLGYRGYSEGKLVTDAKFEDNIVGALKNGVKVGVYFVTQAISEEEAIEEAEYVLDAIAPYNVTWPVALDLEATSGKHPRTENLTAQERTTYVKAFCERIKEAGYTPMLYSNIGWFLQELDLKELTDYDKWFAQYFNQPFFPYEFQAWQYSNSGKVDGISSYVDMNIAFYDYDKKQYVTVETVPVEEAVETEESKE